MLRNCLRFASGIKYQGGKNMKAKKVLTLILALAVCLSGVNVLGISSAFAADNETVIFDTNKKAIITKSSLTADTKNTNSTKYSAKWETDKSKDARFADVTQDFSNHDTIEFSAKVDSTEKVTMLIMAGSENESTSGIDYYYERVTLTPGEWQNVSVKYSDFKVTREPLGWDNIKNFYFSVGENWSCSAAEGTVIYIENVRLTGNPTTMSSASSSDSALADGEVNEENVNKIFYYNNFDGDSQLATNADIVANKNSITQEFDSGDNGYVKIAFSDSSTDCYMNAKTKSTQINDLIVEVSLSTDSKPTVGNMQYKDNTSARKQGTLFSINENGEVMLGDKSAGKLKKGKWLNLGFIIDFTTCTATAYVDGEKIATYSCGTTANDISIMRMYIMGSDVNIGRDLLLDNFAVYGGKEFRDVSEEYEPPKTAVVASAGKDVEMQHPSLSQLNGGVALMLNNSTAYANNQLTQVDSENTNVVPIVQNDRTLVPVRFIAESFGADVSWDASVQSATIKLGNDTIVVPLNSNTISVNGSAVEIDVPAAIVENRTFLPLRAVSESLGKNVLWDSRGLIVITNKDTLLDEEKDVKLSTMLVGLIESGKTASNYAAAPKFTQSIIDEAVKTSCTGWPSTGNSNGAQKSASAIYYLTLASYFDANAAASDGTLCKDAALKQIRYLIAGGNEPFACVGCFWGHAIVASSMVLVKNTPAVYDELTADEKERIDWLMRGLAIAGNWGYNDKNDYSTGVGLFGDFGKGWNPNFRNTYLSVVLSASMYFGGADELDKIFTEFDYDTYIKKYEEYGFTKILGTWTVGGKDLMENGGECFLAIDGIGLSYMTKGQSGGTGAGVKIPFLYNGKRADTMYLFDNLADYTYSYTTISEYGTPGTEDHCYILSGKKSPMEGQMGMMREFASGDGGSGNGGSTIRSRTTYGFDSYSILTTVYANMKLFGGWDSSTKEMREMDNRIYVGNEDLLFKLEEGYRGFSSGHGSDEYEYMFISSGHRFTKDIWKNFHCMLNEEVTTSPDPNLVVLEPVIKAEPKDGITTAPEGAFEAVSLATGSVFAPESYYSIGDDKTSGEVEFDIVLGTEVDDESYDCVVMLDQKAENVGWSGANMLLQFKSGTVKIRNGASYVDTNIRFGANYRFHAKVSFNVKKREYSVTLQRTYPSEDTAYSVENYAFRTGANEISKVDSIAVVKSSDTSNMWVENFKVIK